MAMKLSIAKGTTSLSIYVFIGDSTVTTGAGKTSLAFNTSNLVASYVQPRGTPTAITLATLASAQAVYSSGGFVEVDATNMPGIYRLDVPNAALTGANSVVVMLKGATGMVPVALEVELTGVDNQDAAAFGLSRLDAAIGTRLASADYTTPPTATQNADAMLDQADGIEAGYTLRQVMRLIAAAVAGELGGAATTTITIRNITDTKARITATVDSDGNRTAVAYDVS